MTSLDNGIEIPPSSRVSQVGEEILQEQSRHALSIDSLPPPVKLNILPEAQTSATWTPLTNRLDGLNGMPASVDNQYKVLFSPADDNGPRLTDQVADRIHPGLGRVESANPGQSQWRLDYVDPGRCNTKASVGMCFTLKWR